VGWSDRHRRAAVRNPVAALLCCAVLFVVIGASAVVLAPPVGAQEGGGAEPPVAPAEVRDQVRDVMSRPEFDYSPSWFERALDWIGEQLAKIFEPGDEMGAGSSFGGGIGALIGWLLIVAAVVAIVALVVWIVANRTGRTRVAAEDLLSPVEVEHRRRAHEWLVDAEQLEAQGEWKGALRARYRNLVRTLVDRRQVPDVAGRTTGELREDLDETTPTAHDGFDTCSQLFELAWYAGVATGADENARFQAAAADVLAATVVDRFDPSPSFGPLEVVTVGPGEGEGRR